MDQAFKDAGGSIIMFILAMGVLSFVIDQVLKLVGKGEYIPFVKIGGMALVLGKVIFQIGLVLITLRDFSNGKF